MVMALPYDLTKQEVLIYQEDKESEVMANLGKSAWRKSLTGYSGSRPLAMIRTLIVGVNFITCFFIMANTIRHW